MSFEIARRTQAVAIERGADDAAIGEGDSRGSVPGLHQRRVIFVKRALVGRHGGVGVPRFGNQHRHHMRKAAPGQGQQFDGVIE